MNGKTCIQLLQSQHWRWDTVLLLSSSKKLRCGNRSALDLDRREGGQDLPTEFGKVVDRCCCRVRSRIVVQKDHTWDLMLEDQETFHNQCRHWSSRAHIRPFTGHNRSSSSLWSSGTNASMLVPGGDKVEKREIVPLSIHVIFPSLEWETRETNFPTIPYNSHH